MSMRLVCGAFLSVGLSAVTAEAAPTDGTLDTSFAGTGETTVTVLSGATPTGSGYSVAPTDDGRVTLGGSTSSFLALVRLLADGTPDPTFGNLAGQPGRSTFDLTAAGFSFLYFEGMSPMAGTAGQKIYLGGTSYDNPNYVGLVLRADGNGNLDSAFGGGYARVDMADVTPHNVFARAVLSLADGSVIVTGDDYSIIGTPTYLQHFLANGTLDTTFAGGTGHLHVAAPAGTQGMSPIDLKLASDGSLLVGEHFTPGPGGTRMLVFHVSAGGVLDTTFANNATFAYADFGLAGTAYDTAGHVAVQTDGKILLIAAAGASGAPLGYCGIVRLNSNGIPDSTFASGGVLTYPAGGATSYTCDDAVEQNRSRIIASGKTGSTPVAIAFTFGNGTIDNTFGTAGITQLTASGVQAISVDHDSRPLLVGSTNPTGFYAARLTDDLIFRNGFDGI